MIRTDVKKILNAGMFCQIPVILLPGLKDIFPLLHNAL
jgi:hypothetical protein